MCKVCGKADCRTYMVFDKVFKRYVRETISAATIIERDIASGELTFDNVQAYGNQMNPVGIALINCALNAMKKAVQPRKATLRDELMSIMRVIGLNANDETLVAELESAGMSDDPDALGRLLNDHKELANPV